MTEHFHIKQISLEKEARGLSRTRFLKGHQDAGDSGLYSDSEVGNFLLRQYVLPIEEAIQGWLEANQIGKVSRGLTAVKLLRGLDVSTVAYLTTKAILDKAARYQTNKPVTLTGLAIHVAHLIHSEFRIRAFEEEHKALCDRLMSDFNRRELPRYKREQYLQGAFKKVGLEWSQWSISEKVHVGMALISIFRTVTNDIVIETSGVGKGKKDIVQFGPEMIEKIDLLTAEGADMFSIYWPTVVPPRRWSEDTLEMGGYHSEHTAPYPLVKYSKKGYRRNLKALATSGQLDHVLSAVNAVQETAWKVNSGVLDVVEWAYAQNIPCKKLPAADPAPLPDAPAILQGLTKEEINTHPKDSPIGKAWSEHMAHRFKIHEGNRRIVARRIMAQRAFVTARKFSEFPAIYFPHDLDSRGRMYPKPVGLNPQGPDFIKGLLMFAEGKRLGAEGIYWLGIHGANCYGEDKIALDDRYRWSEAFTAQAMEIANDPKANLSWTHADSPVQFLAWCFDWAAAHALPCRFDHVSHLHVDLDATCSGLQHFSAMLRDGTGGRFVNMTPSDERMDVYQVVADKANGLVEADTENEALRNAWMSFGINRKVTKRPVMVKPYAGTRQSCNAYVAEAVRERLSEGEALPWDKDDLWSFCYYGGTKVWDAIPKVVVAADDAMKWLSKVTRAVAQSQPKQRRINWTSPSGFPVWLSKFDLKTRQIETHFDGKLIKPRVTEETDKLDSRKMGTTVPPSFVHSLDAAHLHLTVAQAHAQGNRSFAVVHDSFGVHAADVEQFKDIIRAEFVSMYERHDVLGEFFEDVRGLITSERLADISPPPVKGNLNLKGVLRNPFFFS